MIKGSPTCQRRVMNFIMSDIYCYLKHFNIKILYKYLSNSTLSVLTVTSWPRIHSEASKSLHCNRSSVIRPGMCLVESISTPIKTKIWNKCIYISKKQKKTYLLCFLFTTNGVSSNIAIQSKTKDSTHRNNEKKKTNKQKEHEKLMRAFQGFCPNVLEAITAKYIKCPLLAIIVLR